MRVFFVKIPFLYLREREVAREGVSREEREEEQGEGEETGSTTRGFIPGPWDCGLSQRQMLNLPSHPGTP